jgi:hypothetical protein
MRHFRFSLSALLWFVVVVAIAFAALASPLGWWTPAFKATTLCCLFFAILAAIRGRQSLRSFWLGFAVVGWGYFALQHVMEAELPTSEVSLRVQEIVRPARFVSGSITNINEISACRDVIRWLWPCLLGFIGGVVTHILDVKRVLGSGYSP